MNLKMKALIDEMKRIGDLPAPRNGGDKHKLFLRQTMAVTNKENVDGEIVIHVFFLHAPKKCK